MKLIVEDFLKQIAHQSSFAKISLHFHEVHLVKELCCSMKSLNNIGALKINSTFCLTVLIAVFNTQANILCGIGSKADTPERLQCKQSGNCN